MTREELEVFKDLLDIVIQTNVVSVYKPEMDVVAAA